MILVPTTQMLTTLSNLDGKFATQPSDRSTTELLIAFVGGGPLVLLGLDLVSQSCFGAAAPCVFKSSPFLARHCWIDSCAYVLVAKQ